MPLVPLPTRVGGQIIGHPDDGRVSGPPSRQFPILRDLANAPATVTIEVDTQHDRVIGVIDHILPSTGSTSHALPERLVLVATPRAKSLRPIQHSVKLPDIIAFRVLSIEVSELPTRL